MGKPSIFSKEYQKKMKRRKKNVIIVSLGIIVFLAALIVKFAYHPIDYSNIKQNIQAWIDSDTTNAPQENQTVSKEEVTKEEPVQEEPQEPVEQSMDINLLSGHIAKAIYIDDSNGGKIFKELKDADTGVSYDISSSGKQMIVMDTNSVITLYNVDGTNKVISKDQYVSTNGSAFTKDSTLQNQPQYLWNASPKFIGEDKMIFITNRPYFGTKATKQYIWMTDIQSGQDKVCWELAGANIQIDAKEEKGVKITIDSKVYYMNESGNCVQ